LKAATKQVNKDEEESKTEGGVDMDKLEADSNAQNAAIDNHNAAKKH
jgi:hypothetical protein